MALQLDIDAILDAALDELDDDVTKNDEIDPIQEEELKESSSVESYTTATSAENDKRESPVESDAPASVPKSTAQISVKKINGSGDTLPSSDSGAALPFEDMLKQMFTQASNTTENSDDADLFDSFLREVKSGIGPDLPAGKTQPAKPKPTKFGPHPKPTSDSCGVNNSVDDTISKLMEGMGNAQVNDHISDDSFPEQEIFAEMMKEFENMGTGEESNLMDGVMSELLSKELMYEPMKQVCEKFPKWLEEEKAKMDAEEFQKRSKQYSCFKELIRVYDTEPKNSEKIMMLMQDVQEYGQPPAAIIEGIAPGLKLDEDGVPDIGNMLGGEMPKECTIM